MFADITSANVVGYSNMDAKDSQNPEQFGSYYAGGACFSTVGKAGAEWKLGDLKQAKGAAMEDFIQFLDPFNGAATYLIATFVTPEEDESIAGWWDITEGDVGETSLDKQTFPAGTAFLGSFTSGGEICFTSSGEVLKGEKPVVIAAGSSYPFIANPLPTTVKLGQVKVAGTAAMEDFFQYLDGEGAAAWRLVTYVTKDEDESIEGWWDITETDVGEVSAAEYELAPGQGILGSFTSSSSAEGDVVLTFPEVLK